MPPNEDCPACLVKVQDWHVEWYKTEQSALYRGLATMDCPLCGRTVGFHKGNIGPAPPGVTLAKRDVDKAAEWAVSQAVAAGGTLMGYISTPGAGMQYAGYWSAQEILQADANEQAKTQGP